MSNLIKRYLGWTVTARLWSGRTVEHVTWFRRGAMEWVGCYPHGCSVSLRADGGLVFHRHEGRAS